MRFSFILFLLLIIPLATSNTISYFENYSNSSYIENVINVTINNSYAFPNNSVPGHPIPDEDTVMLLTFDDSQNPQIDSSLYHLDMNCSLGCPTNISSGKIGSSAYFNTYSLVTVGSLPMYGFTDMNLTWSTWFKTNSSATNVILGSYCGYGHVASHLALNGGQVDFTIAPAGQWTQMPSSTITLNDSQWHNLVATRDTSSGNMSIYIDGVLDSNVTGAIDGGLMNCNKFSVGGYDLSGSGAFNGELDGLALYDRILTQGEISHLYEATNYIGSFESNNINLTNESYDIKLNISSDYSNRYNVLVSFDNGSNWCNYTNDIKDDNCLYPTTQIKYKIDFLDLANIDWINLTANFTPRCIDFDNDGSPHIGTPTENCDIPYEDQNDSNPFEYPQNTNQYCNQDDSDSFVKGSENCFDNLDNDCNGAVDSKDTSCYSGGTIYYISNSLGSDSNQGIEPLHPIKTITYLQSILGNNVNPGDKVLFRRGDKWEGSEKFYVSRGGNITHPFLISSYGFGEQPIINSSVEDDTIISLCYASYTTIEDIHLTSITKQIQTLGAGTCASSNTQNNVTFKNMHLDNLSYGFLIAGENMTIRDSIINDCENSQTLGGHSQGLWVWGGDHGFVYNNTFLRNGKKDVIFDHNIYLGGGNYWLFEGNTLVTTSGTSIVFHGHQKGHIIKSNIFENSTTAVIDISDYTSGQLLSDFTVEGNIFRNNPWLFWIRGPQNVTFKNNLFYNNRNSNAIFAIAGGIDNPVRNFKIYHNTFFNNTGNVMTAGDVDGESIFFIDNIMSNTTEAVVNESHVVFDHNLYFGSTPISTETNNLTGDPQFIDPVNGDFMVPSSSPAVDSGTDVLVDEDFNGNSRRYGSGYDIGAYEYGSTPSYHFDRITQTGTFSSGGGGAGGGGGASNVNSSLINNTNNIKGDNPTLEKIAPRVNDKDNKISSFEYSLWFYIFVVVILLAIGITVFISLLKVLK